MKTYTASNSHAFSISGGTIQSRGSTTTSALTTLTASMSRQVLVMSTDWRCGERAIR